MKPPYVHEWGEGKAYRRLYRRKLPSGRWFNRSLPRRLTWTAPAFMAAYTTAATEYEAMTGGAPRRADRGTVDFHVDRYLKTKRFLGLAENTKKARRNLLLRFAAKTVEATGKRVGDLPLGKMPEAAVRALLAPETLEIRRVMRQALNAMIEAAIEDGAGITENVVAGIRVRTKTGAKKKEGRHSWTAEEIAQYRAHHGPGTRARIAMDLLLLTGQRRGDAVTLGWGNVNKVRTGRIVVVEQEKTGATARIPLQGELLALVQGFPLGGPWLRNELGNPWASGAGFGNKFRDWCNAAGLPTRCRAHGLRKAFCCYWAEQRKTPHEIAAMSGHLSLAEVEHYTAAVDRLRLVEAMMEG